MRCLRFFLMVLTITVLPLSLVAQNVPTPPCPLDIVSFNPGGLSIRVRNTSTKAIVGLSFYAALADATEHWKWYHWDFDDSRPLREFGWNKQIKPGSAKTLSWNFTSLDFEHGSGGLFVVTSILFDDGTSWDENPSRYTCSARWLNSHKKQFTRPVDLPPRR